MSVDFLFVRNFMEELMLVFKMVAVGLIIAVLNQLLQKAGKEEYTLLTTVAGLIIVFMMLIPELADLKDAISSVMEF